MKKEITLITIICDRCGAECEGNGFQVTVRNPDAADGKTIDLCKDCKRALDLWIADRLQKADPEPIKKSGRKKVALDDAKIYELRQAGKTFLEIKKELNIAEGVNCIVNHYRAEVERRETE